MRLKVFFSYFRQDETCTHKLRGRSHEEAADSTMLRDRLFLEDYLPWRRPPGSPPFIERFTGTISCEFLDVGLFSKFWNAVDLESRLADFQMYCKQ